MQWTVILAMFLVGACVGSFINMLIYRTAIRYKLSRKKIHNRQRSFCDYCGKQLGWIDNVPIISWLMLRGKSRCCRKKLPRSYPLVELGTGVLLVVTLLQVGTENWWQVGLSLGLISLMWFSALFDMKYMILPDFSTVIMVMVAGCWLIMGRVGPLPYLMSGVVLMGLFWLMNVLTKGRGMGLGDVKLAFFVGLFLGWPLVVVAFYLTFVSGAVVGLVVISVRGWKAGHEVPFGPFMILGTVMAWWWGEAIISQIPNLPLQ